MKKFKVLFLLLVIFLISTGFIFNRFLTYGSEKIPAFMLAFPEAKILHPEITQDQRNNAVIFFTRVPFVFKSCFDKFIMSKEEPSDLKYQCLLFLPTKKSSWAWALEYLVSHLKNNDPEIRKGAADGLQLCLLKFTLPPGGRDEITSKLSEAWIGEKDWKVQEVLTITLCKYDGKAADVFGKRMNDPDNKIRIVAATSLYAATSDARDLKVLKTLYANSDSEDRRVVMVSAYNLLKEKSKPILRLGVKDKDQKTKDVALKLIKDAHL